MKSQSKITKLIRKDATMSEGKENQQITDLILQTSDTAIMIHKTKNSCVQCSKK